MKHHKIPDGNRSGLGPLWDDDLDHRKPQASRSSKRPWRRRVLETGIALAIIAGLSIGLLSPIFRSPNYGKPLGRDIPEEWPDETRRVVHPDGFSLVFPPGWETYSYESPSHLGGYPRSLIRRRYSGTMWVSRMKDDEPFPSKGLRRIVFQGQPAWEWTDRDLRSDFERPPLFFYRVEFERDGRRYRIGCSLPQDRTTLPPILSLYLSTFRSGPVVTPASSP